MTKELSADQTQTQLPNIPESHKEIVELARYRCNRWLRWYWVGRTTQYGIGIAGIVFTAASIANIEKLSQYSTLFSLVSLVCMVILTFVSPDRMALTYMRAWRKLDKAIVKYQASRKLEKDIKFLADTVGAAEDIIDSENY